MEPGSLHEWVFWIAFGLVAVLIPCLWRLLAILRGRHPEKSREMGLVPSSGNFFGWLRQDNDYRTGLAVLRFLWHREYRQLRDPGLTSLARFISALGVAYVVLFAALATGLIPRSPVETGSDAAEAPAGPRETAYELHRQGRYAEAGKLYDQLGGEGTMDADLLYWRAMARWKEQRRDEALADLRRVMDLDPARFNAYHAADRILSEQKRFEDCIDLWNRYLRTDPDNATAVFERGGAYFRLGRHPEAQADAQRACDLGNKVACKVAADLKARLDR